MTGVTSWGSAPALEFAGLAGTAAHSVALRWLAVPAGLAWAAWLCRYSVRRAQRRLQTQGPEIFALLRTSAAGRVLPRVTDY